MQRPNIIICLSDEQRWDTVDDCGCAELSPNLQRLATEGVRFENAFSTCPVCGPARSTIQTGRYASETGCIENNIALPPGMPTIADFLGQDGYETAYIGKWHLASNGHEGDECFWTRPIPKERRGGWKDYWLAAEVPEYTSHGTAGWLFDSEGRKVEFDKHYRADAYTDFAIDYLRNRETTERPLLMMLSLVEPHAQPFHRLYQGPEPERKRHEYREITYEGYEPWVEEFRDAPLPPDLEELPGQAKAFWPDYLAACKRVDWNVGRLLETLDTLGMANETLFIFTSDHGCHFFSHHETVAKSTEHESSTHIPMLLRGPELGCGIHITDPVSLIDLAPTVLNAAQQVTPSDWEGIPLQEIVSRNNNRQSVRIELPGPAGKVFQQRKI